MIPDHILKMKSEVVTKWVISHMEKNHKGHINAAKKDLIIHELFNITPKDAEYSSKERLFRDIIEEAIRDNGALIISSESDGYWWAASLSDGLDYAEKKMKRARTIMANAKKLVDNLKERYGGQIGMGL